MSIFLSKLIHKSANALLQMLPFGIPVRRNKIIIQLDFSKNIEKVNQIELDETYAYVSCTVIEEKKQECKSWIGVDLNTTGHCLVASDSRTGKVLKLGKSANHLHQKYKNVRKKLQKKKKYQAVKKIKNKESKVIKDLNHKISKKIVLEAKSKNTGIVLEDLKGIRKTTKTSN